MMVDEISSAEQIPRAIFLVRILRLCFFPVFTVLLGTGVILGVPQARETVLAFNGPEAFTSQQVCFGIAFSVWMISAWYIARLLVSRRFKPDLVGICMYPGFARAVMTHLPRILAVIAGAPIALFLIVHGAQRGLGLVLLFLSAAIWLGLVFRRQLITDHGPEVFRNSLKGYSQKGTGPVEMFDKLHWLPRIVIVIALICSFALLIALPMGMEVVARYFGSPALLLFALASWTLFGGLILTYWPKAAFSQPAWTWAPALLFILFSPLNENHFVASGVADHRESPKERRELEREFSAWLAARPNPNDPVIFVASAGGASRAAYWATTTLGLLEDEARHQGKRFSQNIFVISGISGGSVGAAAFVTALDAVHHATPSALGTCGSVRALANAFTAKDHLATVVGFMLYPDLMQRFLPIPIATWDRSLALEKVWERDWQTVAAACPRDASAGKVGGQGNPWSERFIDLRTRSSDDSPLPHLALTTTALGRGQRVFQSEFTMPYSDAFDLLDARFKTQELTLAQAAHNSARFPYISPGGVIRCADSNTCDVWDRVGDGGYVEASAALTLIEMLRHLEEMDRIIKCPAHGASCEQAIKRVERKEAILDTQVRIILLDNTPSQESQWLCTAKQGKPETVNKTVPVDGQGKMLLPDVLAPLVGAFSTRGGRGQTAEFELAAIVGGCFSESPRIAELRLPKDPIELEPSMNWMLNDVSRKQMDAAIEGTKRGANRSDLTVPHANLMRNMALIRGWLGTQAEITGERNGTR